MTEPVTYAELQVTTHFSFLRGASSPKELLAEAAVRGIRAVAVTDRNSLAGMVRAYEAAGVTRTQLIIGCRLDLRCGTSLLVYPTDKAAYSRMCRMLSIGKARAGKGVCDLGWDDLADWSDGLIAVLLPDADDARTRDNLTRLRFQFGDRAYFALTFRRRPREGERLLALSRMAAALRVPAVATGDVLYHSQERRMLQDVVTCIREKCTVDTLGYRRERNADRAIKTESEMRRRFRRYLGDESPVDRTAEIARRCTFSFDELQYEYPEETHIPGLTEQQALERLSWEAAETRYPGEIPREVHERLTYELELIGRMDYARYFLTVNRIVQWARSRKILCQGRGSAANSTVCYVLGITALDPMVYSLLFDRFVSTERREPPDIDVDFDHGRREEVIQWIFDTYGRDRAAMCATVSRYRSRGAIREVGKALGLSEDMTAALSGQLSSWSVSGVDPEHASELNFDVRDARLVLAIDLARQLIGTPRHLSQHPGGFVLTRQPLDQFAVIEPAAMDKRQVVEWDKDDIDVLKMMKVDVLGLGMLGCMQGAFDLFAQYKKDSHLSDIPLKLDEIPQEDIETYKMIQGADTLGVFQIESRAQMSMLPRLKPVNLYDLVVQIAIVRPGPIQGDMVHPYLRRREKKEPVEFPSDELKELLEKTFGVPLFQEQAMRIAMVCGQFTAAEADQLRRSMATFKTTGGVSHFKEKLVSGMVGRGYERDFAERLFKQIEGFGSYGFPESHAASFAILAYASSWIKCHHPDVFCCALLNAQPMGFYAPAQIVRDARDHHVEVRPVDVNISDWDSTLEPCAGSNGGFAVRMGLRFAKGLKEKGQGDRIVEQRGARPFASPDDLSRRAGLTNESLVALARGDAFASMGLSRRQALWAVRGLRDRPLSLFDVADSREVLPEVIEPPVVLVPMTRGAEVVEDYHALSLSLRNHPLSFVRSDLAALGARPCGSLKAARDRHAAMVAGIVLVRQQPGSAKGVIFMTLEDESGIANVVVWRDVYAKFRRLILSTRMIGVRGRVQKAGEVIHLVAESFVDLSGLLRSVGGREVDLPAGRMVRGLKPPQMIKVQTRDFR